jgi:hypothetical protein
MVAVFVILGFLTGTSVASSLVVSVLSDERETAYWSLVKRHLLIEHLARLFLVVFVITCGFLCAYLASILA